MTDTLDHLLADLADAATHAAAGGALGGDAPAAVHRITTRVRRRRAARHTGQGVAAACAAGVLVAGTAHLHEVLRTPFPGGAAATSAPDTRPEAPPPTGQPQALESAVAHASAEADGASKAAADAEAAAVEQQLEAALHAAAAIFRCGEPVHTTIHTRPDTHGLLLAADDDLTAVVSGVAQATWHADLPTAARYALVGTDGTVVAQLVEDDAALTRVDGTQPEQQYRLSGALHVVGCPDARDVTPGEKLVAWPYVSADVYSSTADTTATPVVVIADPREITVP